MEDRSAIVAQVEAWAREKLEASGSVAHGWPHTDRVRRNMRASGSLSESLAEAAPTPPLYASDQLLGQMVWVNNLNTGTARQMAQERYAFMQTFAEQVRRELWDDSGPASNPQLRMRD